MIQINRYNLKFLISPRLQRHAISIGECITKHSNPIDNCPDFTAAQCEKFHNASKDVPSIASCQVEPINAENACKERNQKGSQFALLLVCTKVSINIIDPTVFALANILETVCQNLTLRFANNERVEAKFSNCSSKGYIR